MEAESTFANNLVNLTFFRHVMLPKEIAKLVPKTHLMSEAEWRALGVQQSQGWCHYMIHEPGMTCCIAPEIFKP